MMPLLLGMLQLVTLASKVGTPQHHGLNMPFDQKCCSACTVVNGLQLIEESDLKKEKKNCLLLRH